MADDPLNPFPLPAPPAPTVRSEFEWRCLPPEEQWARIAESQSFFLNRSTPAVSPSSSGAGIIEVTQPIDMDSRSLAGANPAPTAEQLASMRDDAWKKY